MPPMDTNYAPIPPAKKPGMKWWVIALIVLAVLCCCCSVTGVLLWNFGDQLFPADLLEEFNYLIPLFAA